MGGTVNQTDKFQKKTLIYNNYIIQGKDDYKLYELNATSINNGDQSKFECQLANSTT